MWEYVAPAEAMGHALRLGRGSWISFDSRLSTTLPTRSATGRTMGKNVLWSNFVGGNVMWSQFVVGASANAAQYFLLYAGRKGASFSDMFTWTEINLQ